MSTTKKLDQAIGSLITVWVIVALIACFCLIGRAMAQEIPQKNVEWERKLVPTYVIHKVTSEQLEQLNLRRKLVILINQTFADEANGIHDVKKFREIKRLTAKIKE